MIKGCIQLGGMPSTGEHVELTPVDYVSKAIVALSRRKASLGQAFHLFNPATISIDDLVAAANAFGYPLQRVAYDAWLDEAERLADASTENVLAPLMALFPRKGQIGSQGQAPKRALDRRNAVTALSGTSITCPPADSSLIFTYLSYLVQCGFLAAPERIRTTEDGLSPGQSGLSDALRL